MNADVVLQAHGLSCGYGRRVVLDDLTIEARRGRFVCIVGPNGAGKTTLLRTLAGLLPPLDGTVDLAGRPLASIHPGERARELSVVLTHSDVPGYLTVQRLVELGRHPYTGVLARLDDADRAAIEQALAETGTAHLRERWVAELSDGERQRAAVARALAQGADVMILDEPTAFLDVAARVTLMSTLRRIAHETGRLIVTTSHDVELVLRTADVVILVGADATITTGSPEDLVLSGAVGALFGEGSLRFDETSGTFRLPEPLGLPVRVEGDGLIGRWTAHAVERIGRPAVRKGHAECVVTITEGPPASWSIAEHGKERRADSLEELAELLRR